MNIKYGISSLLFIISSINILLVSNSIMYKISNILLIFSSFLCNSTSYNSYLLFDYLVIYLISSSFINNNIINTITFLILLLEYSFYNTINYAKNISFILSISKFNILAYYDDSIYFTCMFSITLSSIFTFLIRNYYFYNNMDYVLYLTILWHICMCIILFNTAYYV